MTFVHMCIWYSQQISHFASQMQVCNVIFTMESNITSAMPVTGRTYKCLWHGILSITQMSNEYHWEDLYMLMLWDSLSPSEWTMAVIGRAYGCWYYGIPSSLQNKPWLSMEGPKHVDVSCVFNFQNLILSIRVIAHYSGEIRKLHFFQFEEK